MRNLVCNVAIISIISNQCYRYRVSCGNVMAAGSVITYRHQKKKKKKINNIHPRRCFNLISELISGAIYRAGYRRWHHRVSFASAKHVGTRGVTSAAGGIIIIDAAYVGNALYKIKAKKKKRRRQLNVSRSAYREKKKKKKKKKKRSVALRGS